MLTYSIPLVFCFTSCKQEYDKSTNVNSSNKIPAKEIKQNNSSRPIVEEPIEKTFFIDPEQAVHEESEDSLYIAGKGLSAQTLIKSQFLDETMVLLQSPKVSKADLLKKFDEYLGVNSIFKKAEVDGKLTGSAVKIRGAVDTLLDDLIAARGSQGAVQSALSDSFNIVKSKTKRVRDNTLSKFKSGEEIVYSKKSVRTNSNGKQEVFTKTVTYRKIENFEDFENLVSQKKPRESYRAVVSPNNSKLPRSLLDAMEDGEEAVTIGSKNYNLKTTNGRAFFIYPQ